MQIRRHLTESGRDAVGEWLTGIKDVNTRARVTTRISRLESGNFGDCRPVGGGVRELRIEFGPGYRLYYTIVGPQLVLLLCGGDKRKQTTDIRRAMSLLNDYRQRTREV